MAIDGLKQGSESPLGTAAPTFSLGLEMLSHWLLQIVKRLDLLDNLLVQRQQHGHQQVDSAIEILAAENANMRMQVTGGDGEVD